MENSEQQAFIDRVRAALGHNSSDRPGSKDLCIGQYSDETEGMLERIKNRSAAERRQLLDRLIEMARPINLNVIAVDNEGAAAAAIADLVRSKEPEWGDFKSIVAWKHPLIERLDLSRALASQKVPVYITDPAVFEQEDDSGQPAREGIRQQVVEAYVGGSSV